jgi:hypothetical protein
MIIQQQMHLAEAIRKMTGTPEATTRIQSHGTSPEAPNK